MMLNDSFRGSSFIFMTSDKIIFLYIPRFIISIKLTH